MYDQVYGDLINCGKTYCICWCVKLFKKVLYLFDFYSSKILSCSDFMEFMYKQPSSNTNASSL